MRRSCKAFSCEHEVEMAEHQRQFFLLLFNPALTYIVRLLSRLVEMIHMMLYEEESKGLDGPEKISAKWPARCHVTYHVHAELKETSQDPPYQHIFLKYSNNCRRFKFGLLPVYIAL